jgi:hypothetical protein
MSWIKKTTKILKASKTKWIHSTFMDIRRLIIINVVIPAKKHIKDSIFELSIEFNDFLIKLKS